MKTNELLKNIFVTYNHSPATQKAYVYALKQYSNYFGMNLHKFLREAEDEENWEIKWKHRKIKTRLLEFRQYYLSNYALNTTRPVMMCVIKFYKFYDIEIYSLPKINQKSIRKPQPINYSNLPIRR